MCTVGYGKGEGVLVLTRRGLDIKMCSAEMSYMLLLSGCVTLRAFCLWEDPSYFINMFHAYAGMGTYMHAHEHTHTYAHAQFA